MKRAVIAITALLLASAIVAGATILYLFNVPMIGEKREVIFEVRPGSFASTARSLQEQGLIRSAFQFRLMGRLTGYANKVRVGEYQLFADMKPLEILETISSGKSIQHALTIPEGSNIFEISQVIETSGVGKRDQFLKLCADKKFLKKYIDYELSSCEGYLFPETYAYTKYSTLEKMLGQMLDMFRDRFKSIAERGSMLGLNRHQVVTLASIIEKETGADDERKIVSSVYHNRLKIKMRLQADPTTLYGKMVASNGIQNNITRDDLHTVNAYNTYAMSGLPAGPIASPGLASLEAAVSPANTDYLYFVSQNDGHHIFSKDFKTHNSAVSNFQKDASARRGKSWRDLKKTSPRPKSANSR